MPLVRWGPAKAGQGFLWSMATNSGGGVPKLLPSLCRGGIFPFHPRPLAITKGLAPESGRALSPSACLLTVAWALLLAPHRSWLFLWRRLSSCQSVKPSASVMPKALIYNIPPQGLFPIKDTAVDLIWKQWSRIRGGGNLVFQHKWASNLGRQVDLLTGFSGYSRIALDHVFSAR